jgi:cysteine synthase A
MAWPFFTKYVVHHLINNYMKARGKTPLITLEKLSEPGCVEIYVKYGGTNPTESMKDRMALSMIEAAEMRHE